MRTRKQWAKHARRRLVANAGDAQVCWMTPGELWHRVVAEYVNTYRHEVRITRRFRHMLEKTKEQNIRAAVGRAYQF